jgi:hypothetical protein
MVAGLTVKGVNCRITMVYIAVGRDEATASYPAMGPGGPTPATFAPRPASFPQPWLNSLC